MSLITAQDYIYNALRKCGQLRPGYTESAELLSDGLDEFKAMFDSYNARRTMNYSIPDYIYEIGSSTGLDGIYGPSIQFTIGPSFTISATLTSGLTTALVANTFGLIIGQTITGTGIQSGTTIQAISVNSSITLSNAATATGAQIITVLPSFSGPRPEGIVRMNLYMTSTSPSQPTRIPIQMVSAEQWAAIPVLQITAINVTTTCYYDPQMPQGVLNVWPPLNGNSLEIFTWGFLTPPVALTTGISLPPGYADVIIWDLARRMWPMLTKSVLVNKVSHQWLCGQAAIARKAVMDVNRPRPKLTNDFRGGRGSNAVCDWSLLLTGSPY